MSVCPPDFEQNILDTPEFYSTFIQTFGLVAIPVHLFGAWCIVFRTPAQMGSVKWSMLNVHFWMCLMDVAMSWLTTPFALLPVLAGYPLGLLKYTDISIGAQTYFMVMIEAIMFVAIIGIFENRFLILSSENHWWRRFRYPWFLLNYVIAVVFFYPVYMSIPEDQVKGKQIVLERIPCLPAEIRAAPIAYIAPDPDTYKMVALPETLFICVQLGAFFLLITYSLTEYGHNHSKKTLDLQKKFVRALVLQLALPFTVLLVPLIYMGSAATYNYYNQKLTNASFVIVSSHGFFSTLAMLVIQGPYREVVLQMTSCEPRRRKRSMKLNSIMSQAQKSPDGFHILNPKWEEMEFIFVAVLWILVTCVCKIVFTKLKQNDWINVIPESALQIILGLVLAALFHWIRFDVRFFVFDAHTFFAFLLPPIIFDAGYFMPNREFFGNFDSIMTFAVIGTVFNTFVIGICLAVMNSYSLFSMQTSDSEMLLFASLISAVDPVAVIAVFEEMHVNKPLFVTVFGEALFNDAISVVLFGIFKSFTLTSSEPSESSEYLDYFLGFIAFFVVSFGGVLLGILSAFACAVATKFTAKTPVIAALLVFVLSYLGYVISEICSFSSIIAAAVCGMTVKQYLERNMTSPCLEAVSVMTRNLAISTESLTFILLGLATISTAHHWDTLFVLSTVFFCVFFRFVAIFGLAAVLRFTRNKRIPLNELLVMSCGGLRGAIAFGVVLSMPDAVQGKSIFVTATLAVIFFSVGIQGMLIRPLLKLLRIETLGDPESHHDTSENLAKPLQTIVEGSVFHAMQVVEVTSDHIGIHRIKEVFDYANTEYLMPWLTRNRI